MIETLVPRMRLSRVDLPTLGRPTTAAKPERKVVTSGSSGAGAGHAGRCGPARSGGPLTRSATSRTPSTVDRLALDRDVAEQVEHQAADGVPRPSGRSASSSSLTSSTASRAFTRELARCQPLDRRLLDVVLVDDLADQLLDQVLEGDQPGGAAVLVDHDRHVELLGLHLPHQLGDPLGLGHEVGGPQVGPDRLVARAPARTPRIRSLV